MNSRALTNNATELRASLFTSSSDALTRAPASATTIRA
jgi:hypothetical protein